MADVFLSYNREDQPKAKIIAEALEADGFEVWWDTVLRAGQTYDEVTERQLRDAWAVVVLWSSRSVQSKWVRAEATLGDRKSALIPVMIEPCDRPIMFELIQTADLTQWDGDLKDANWLAFLADVREHVERKRAAKPQPAPAAAPQPSAPRAATPALSRPASPSSAQAPPRRAKKSNAGLLFVGAAALAIAAAAFCLKNRTRIATKITTATSERFAAPRQDGGRLKRSSRERLAPGLRSSSVSLRPVRPRFSTTPAALPRCLVLRFFFVWAMSPSSLVRRAWGPSAN